MAHEPMPDELMPDEPPLLTEDWPQWPAKHWPGRTMMFEEAKTFALDMFRDTRGPLEQRLLTRLGCEPAELMVLAKLVWHLGHMGWLRTKLPHIREYCAHSAASDMLIAFVAALEDASTSESAESVAAVLAQLAHLAGLAESQGMAKFLGRTSATRTAPTRCAVWCCRALL